MGTPFFSMNSTVRVRLVWRLVFCLFGQLTLLLILAICLELSLNSVKRYTPVAAAEEAHLETVEALPAMMAGMDAERRAYQAERDPADMALFTQARRKVEEGLGSLQAVTAGPEEAKWRALVAQWLAAMGSDPGVQADSFTAGLSDERSRAMLDQLNAFSDGVRAEVQGTRAGLQQREASEVVTLIWILVASVMLLTILIQLAFSHTIIAPIRSLQAMVRRLQAGDYTARAHLQSGDEIQSLGETFNAMAENILLNQRELEEKNEALFAQQEALRDANARLEERVSEKTEEMRHTLAEAEADREKLRALRQELEDKNEKLSAAARLRDEFLATLSHELRTPLTPVITCAHLLGTDPRMDAEQLKSVQVIERNARALSRMIDELLDLSAVMNRKLQLIRERTELNEWVRATLETIRPAWEKKKLELTFYPANGPVELEIDPTRLAQVLTNLVNNAIKFTDAGGKISVRLTALKKETRLAVTDTGAGLDRRETERIFEMFHQTRTRRTAGVGGLGVGLSVARSLAELHGGGLRAESPGLGKGATFTLWLPPSETGMFDFSPMHAPAPRVDRSILKGRKILLVEDATDTREALQRIFERRGCRVRTAATGEEALELAVLEAPEIVVSDIGLPGLSGLELMKRLKALPGLKDVVAIALSGLGREKDVTAATAAGFQAHLLKPVEIAELDRTLVEAWRKRRVGERVGVGN